MEITGGGKETPLSAIRLSRMEVPPSEALDMSGSLHLFTSYLFKNKCEGFEVKVLWLFG